jgi:uncharacterized protein (DUF2252 family)
MKTTASTWAAREARRKAGKALRNKVARAAHGVWKPAKSGRDPLAILHQTDAGRVQQLLPIRYGRMLQSSFAFLRGSAAVMAFDLANTPATGIRVQACGDAHLMNFGGFATPERNLVFDVNDFDETLPAPWEWDIKRLAASVMVAAQYRSFAPARCSAAVLATVRAYREKLREYSELAPVEVWHARIDAKDVVNMVSRRSVRQLRDEAASRAHVHAASHSLPKITEIKGGKLRIKDTPPLLFHDPAHDGYVRVTHALARYRDSLADERRALLDRYRCVDAAIKVVGVGSVGTRCAVALFLSEDEEPLFLQFKEARASVLEPYAGQSSYKNHAQRVVIGQRAMQSASDLFLGWSSTGKPAFDFYVRQLRDMKTSVNVDTLRPSDFIAYAGFCGCALARAHAKTGDAAMISGYLGRGNAFDRALVAFARSYAHATEMDHGALIKAVRSEKLKVAY